MNGLLSFLAWGVLIALGFWLLGGVVLRVGGALLAFGGLLCTAMTGSPSAALLTVLGALAWLAGHWLYAVRHHEYASPLARRIFNQALPRTLNATRRWGIPNVPPERR
ncbi:MAG TPA: hypothetical protein VHS55_03370 [Solirubrobacteraceae bacterium]|jgi:hypothetical protein|nr:hypothetical protein [Solirubrobacteraceae bacterium]